MTTPALWWLLDATNILYRDAHAMGIDAAPQNLAGRLQLIRDHWRPSRIVCCFDGPGPTWRHDLFEGYKAGRQRLPGIADAIAAAVDVCDSLGIEHHRLNGIEADDLIATLTAQAIESDARAVIYSADRDLHQLLREGQVSQLLRIVRRRRATPNDHGLDLDWLTWADVGQRYGIGPAAWVDYRAMVGDTSDHVPGVRGIGPKTAAQVLQDCGTLARFYASPFTARITPKQRTALFNARDRVQLLRDLFTLRRDVPLDSPHLSPLAGAS
jgi:DNA polymerase-1